MIIILFAPVTIAKAFDVTCSVGLFVVHHVSILTTCPESVKGII